MKRQLILATLAISFAMFGNAHAGAGHSHPIPPASPPPTTAQLPTEYIIKIKNIRKYFFGIIDSGRDKSSARQTVMWSSSHAPFVEGHRELAEEHKSEDGTECSPAPRHKDIRMLTGHVTDDGKVPVVCYNAKIDIRDMINGSDLTNEQKLLALKMICAPRSVEEACDTECSTTRFMDGLVDRINSIEDSSQVCEFKASLTDGGTLNISCTLTTGEAIECFI